MKRISVSIPDTLWGRMQDFKAQLNFSLLAREAIEREVAKLEVLKDPAKDLAEIINRFKQEKEEIMDRWEKEGFELGQEWVKSATLSEVEGYIESLSELKRTDEPWPDRDTAAEYTENYREDPEWTNTAATGFWRGFPKGAKSLWREIEKKL